MPARDLASRLTRRARRAGVDMPAEFLTRIEAYFELLTKWNRRINLTAFHLEPPSDEALDRLVIEPLAAARKARKKDVTGLDIGSGGGSPGIPFYLAAPWVRMMLVEVKVRKCAFLREVARQIPLPGVEVENRRFEELLARTDLLESIDVVTLRAVRPNPGLWNTVQAFLKPGGRAFWFVSSGSEKTDGLPLLTATGRIQLVPALGSQLIILTKSK